MILDNTRELLSILRERVRLAEKLVEAKSVTGTPVRDREQESRVIASSGDLSQIEKRILNMIFEFTINVQERSNGGEESEDIAIGDSPFEIWGEPSALSYLAGLLISMPGKEIFCRGEPGPSIRMGIIDNGGHLVTGTAASPDMLVCVGFDDERCSLSVDLGGRMRIHPSVIVKRHFGTTMIEVA